MLGSAVPCGKLQGLPAVNLIADKLILFVSCSAVMFEGDMIWCSAVKPDINF